MRKNVFINICRGALIWGALGMASPAAAQLHEEVSVEGRYVPDVIRVDRVNAFPKALRQSLLTEPLKYEREGVATPFVPSLLTMPATGWRASRQLSRQPGYLEAGTGSWLSSTLSAGYRFIDNSTTLLGAKMQFNSTSLWKPEMSEATKDVRRERYDLSVGVYGSHVVKGHGRLDLSLDYHVGYFNYYGYTGLVPYTGSYRMPADDAVSISAPWQTINDVAFRADWRSLITPGSNVAYNVTAKIRHFGYRALPVATSGDAISGKGSRETNVGLSGGLVMPWENGSSIGFDAALETVFLSEVAEGIDDYGLLTLTPYYRFNKGLLDIRLGADIDLAFRAGREGDRYPFLHVAPDVRLALQTGQVGLYLNATGGTRLNTLAALHELDYYGVPAVVSTRPSHTPLDAAFGVNLGPFSGFSMGVEGRFRASKNVPLGGWYTTSLDFPSHIDVPEGLTPALPGSDWNLLYCDDTKGINLHGLSLGVRMAYEHGDLFSISAEGSYQAQDGKKGFFYGYDRPELTAALKVEASPVKPLRVYAGYDFRGKRAIYVRSVNRTDAVVGGESEMLHFLPLADISLLGLGGSWSFSDNLSVWLQAENLLNRHDAFLPMQPVPGVTLTAGVKWLF